MAECRIWSNQTITSTTLSDHFFDVALALGRVGKHCLIRNSEGYITGSGDSCTIRFNGSETQKMVLLPGETLSVDFDIYTIEAAAIGTSGANDLTLTLIVS